VCVLVGLGSFDCLFQTIAFKAGARSPASVLTGSFLSFFGVFYFFFIFCVIPQVQCLEILDG
jgi:hypothetical protein